MANGKLAVVPRAGHSVMIDNPEDFQDAVCGFVLVAGPDPVQARRAREFWGRLETEQIHLVGLVANRVRVWPGGSGGPGGGPPPPLDESTCAAGATSLAKALAERDADLDAGAASRAVAASNAVAETARRFAASARRHQRVLGELVASLPLDTRDARVIPLFAEDVHALEGLRRMGKHVFDE